MRERSQPGLTTLLIAYIAFIWLGMPDGMLGVAWPSMQKSFDVSLDSLGILLGASTVGYLISSSSSGRLVARIGIGIFLLGGSLLRGVGLIGYAIAPSWPVLIAFGAIVGFGGGTIDAGFNTYVATHYSTGRLNWLHAAYGVGATISPLIMTALIDVSRPWQWGYAITAILQATLTIGLLLTMRYWRISPEATSDSEPEPTQATAWETLKLPAVWFGIMLFILYTGTEISSGQWPYSMFTESRGISTSTAGVWVSVYWGALTAGRFLMGIVADRVGTMRVLRLSMIGSVIGALLIWSNIALILNFAGMALMGFSLATIFPSLIAITPARVGRAHAANAIGFQIGAAGVGVATLPAIAGVLAKAWGLEVIGPFLVVSSLLMTAIYELTIHRSLEQPRAVVARAPQ